MIFMVLSPLLLSSCILATHGLSVNEIQTELKSYAVGRKDIPRNRVAEILQAIQTDSTLNQLITNEIQLRRLYTLKFDAHCTTTADVQKKLLNPPDKLADYLTWQNNFIQENKPLCDPLANTQCRHSKCKCQIYLDSQYHCAITKEEKCGEFYERPDNQSAYMDPLSLHQSQAGSVTKTPFRYANTPKCSSSIDCAKFDYYAKSYCFITSKHQELSTAVSGLAELGPQELCDPTTTTSLYRTDPKELERFYHTDDKLANMKNTGQKFCDPKQLLYCGQNSLCECLAPTILNSNTKRCEIPIWQKCYMKGTREEVLDFFTDKHIASIVHHSLAEGFKNAPCDQNGKCSPALKEGLDLDYAVCACRSGTTGRNCEAPLAELLKKVKMESLPSDMPTFDERLQKFVEFNKKFIQFEKRLALGNGQPCDSAMEAMSDELIQFAEILASPDSGKHEHLSGHVYDKMTKLAHTVAAKGIDLCDSRQDVHCVSEKCKRKNLNQEMKILNEKITRIATGEAGDRCTHNITSSDGTTRGRIAHFKMLLRKKAKLCNYSARRLSCKEGRCACMDNTHSSVHGNCLLKHVHLHGLQSMEDTDSIGTSLHYGGHTNGILVTIILILYFFFDSVIININSGWM